MKLFSKQKFKFPSISIFNFFIEFVFWLSLWKMSTFRVRRPKIRSHEFYANKKRSHNKNMHIFAQNFQIWHFLAGIFVLLWMWREKSIIFQMKLRLLFQIMCNYVIYFGMDVVSAFSFFFIRIRIQWHYTHTSLLRCMVCSMVKFMCRVCIYLA